MRRALGSLAALLICLMSVQATAAPKKPPRRPVCDERTTSDPCRAKRDQIARDAESARTHDLDPAGNYRGYPDWARRALSPPTTSDQ